MKKVFTKIVYILVICVIFSSWSFEVQAESYEEYINQVEKQIGIMQDLVDEIDNIVLPERIGKIDQLIEEKENLITQYEEDIEYYKNQEQDEYTRNIIQERKEDKEFQTELVNTMEKYRNSGLSVNTEEGTEAYRRLEELSPVGIGTFGYGAEAFGTLSGIYLASIKKSILVDLISLCQEAKVTGITEDKYNELLQTYEYWLNNNLEGFGKYAGEGLVSEQEPVVYNLLLALGKEYAKKQAPSPTPTPTPSKTPQPTEEPNEEDDNAVYSPNAKIPRGIAFVKGRVQIKRAGSDAWIRGRKGMPLGPGDRVRTLRNSYAELGCGNGDEFSTFSGNDIVLYEKSTITVPDKVLKVHKESNIKVILDHVTKKTYELFGKDEFEVDTPTSVAGIRGTEFIIQVDQDGNTIFILNEGTISVSSKYDESSETLESGQTITVPADKVMGEAENITDDEKQMFTEKYREKIVSNRLTINENKEITVFEEGELLSFTADKNGEYVFNLSLAEESQSENWLQPDYEIAMEILNDDKSLLKSNVGDKYDLYDNSHNKGDTVAIGEGGNTEGTPIYYKSIKLNCTAGENYYVNLKIPDKIVDSELLENAVPVEITDTGDIIEKDDQESIISRDATISVSYLGPQENEDANNGMTWVIILGAIVIAAGLLVFVISKAGKKNNT